ncbi:MAG TPA: methyl-accepting chemotaxis protein [Dissulfurispiraceae bacterium]|nr:methyl-accepting chemotaxis protein [Dissulfurispiraceae bacterium]
MVYSIRDWKISTKIIAMSLFVILLFVMAVIFYFLPVMSSKMMDEKRSATRGVVDVAFALIAEYDARVQKGEFTLAEAQKRAMTRIKNLRYKGNEYFWINDMHPTMIMHPTKPELDGKDLSENKDPNGKRLFIEMINVCREKGEGFVDYMWPKPGETKPVPKVSYVKLYQPWGWVVGSGIYADDVAAELAKVRQKILIATAVGSIIIIPIIFLISVFITKPLRAGVIVANKMADGDFTSPDLEVKSRDEAGTLATALNKTKNALNQLLGSAMASVVNTAGQVSSASEELSATVNQITRRLDEQSKKSIQVATAATEMSQTVVDIAKNASSIATSADDTLKVARNGGKIVDDTVSEVQIISNAVADSSQMIKTLGERSQQIFEIVDVIKDIADQTNLLALNAAIEAARAGEQGRGFAVVADEVRKLAEKTSKATAEVGEMIGAIQSETGRAVSAMSESQSRVEKGVALSSEAGTALHKILDSVHGLQSMVQQIASATEEMSTVSESISADIEVVANASKENSASAIEIEAASNNLARLSSEMQEVTRKFKTDSQKK